MFKLYCFLSAALTIGAIYNSFNLHEQFYTAALYLSVNKINASILLNFLVMIVSITITLYVKLFFGELKEIEKISLMEKVKKHFLETIIYFSICFDREINFFFFIKLIPFLTLQLIHWTTAKRAKLLISESSIKFNTHFKLIIAFILLIYVYVKICLQYIESFDWQNQDSANLFLFTEYFNRLLKILFSFFKYAINIFEILTYSHFEKKQTVFLILDIFINIIELCLYITLFVQYNNFLFLLLIVFAVPSIFKKCKALTNQIKLMLMIEKIQNVEKIEYHENICLICLGELEEGKLLTCGHIYHKGCLKTWITGNINQFCPKCKEPIKLEEKPNQIQKNPNQRLQQKILYQELKEIKGTISLLQIMTQYRQISSQVQNPCGSGSVQFGLPCEATQQYSTTTEIRRLQINFMNKIVRGIEQGIIHPRLLPKCN